MGEKLAVIVPVYNVEAYVASCLDSLKAQTYQDWVAYVVDDGSTDRSGEIVDEYKNDERFVILHKENGGLSSARNYALDYIDNTNAVYSAVTFLDSDDWISPDAYEVLMSALNEHNADIVFSGFKRVFPDGRITEAKFSRKEGIASPSEYFAAVFSYGDCWRGKNGSWGVVWNKIFRMNCIRSHRFIEDRKFNEDELFGLQVGLDAEKFYFIDRSFVFYRQRYDSLVRANGFSIKLIRGREACLRYLSGFSDVYIEDVKKYICSVALNTIIEASKDIPVFVDNFIYISLFLYNIKDVIYAMFESKEINVENYKFVKFIISLHESNVPVDKAINYLVLYNVNVTNEKINILSKKLQNIESVQSKINIISEKLQNIEVVQSKLNIISKKMQNFEGVQNKINIMSEHIQIVHEMNKFSLVEYMKYRFLSKITIGERRERYKLKYKELKKVYKRLKK